MFLSWKEFKKGKTKKYDVRRFEINLEKSIEELHLELGGKTYQHSLYHSFYIQDPKLRHIHKAMVKDRVLHHAVFRVLYPIFDPVFIYDSYSCRLKKGTHRAINRFGEFARKVSKNNSRTCWILKCDIRKFFDSIDHAVLTSLIKKKVNDQDVLWLLNKILISFSADKGKGIPMGNITSQLFANIYLNEFDQFIKHQLKVKYYLRYCDDFITLSESRNYLEQIISSINIFLQSNLRLSLHPNKISINTLVSGIDFLGWVNFLNHRVLRTKTKRRMFNKLSNNLKRESLNSYFLGSEGNKDSQIFIAERVKKICSAYLGLIKHGNSHKIKEKLLKIL